MLFQLVDGGEHEVRPRRVSWRGERTQVLQRAGRRIRVRDIGCRNSGTLDVGRFVSRLMTQRLQLGRVHGLRADSSAAREDHYSAVKTLTDYLELRFRRFLLLGCQLIFGDNYFGVVANGDAGNISLDILNSNIHDIGESPRNGTQHGVGIYWRAFFAAGNVKGRIVGNTITGYQKGGIVTNGVGTQVNIFDNTVTGDGHVNFIAQNGIQVGYGANASVMRNTVSGNSFVGFPGDGSASGGIIVVGGAGYGQCPDGNDCPYTVNTQVNDNVLVNNDVGVYLTNLAADFSAPAKATNVKAVNNTISDDQCFNLSYQAGISDVSSMTTFAPLHMDKAIRSVSAPFSCDR